MIEFNNVPQDLICLIDLLGGDFMSSNQLAPKEYADQTYRLAQGIIFYLLGLCPSTNQDVLLLGVDSQGEVEESPGDPSQDPA